MGQTLAKVTQRLLPEPLVVCLPRSTRVTASDNAITNGLEVFRERSGATRVMASNNDNMLRVFDAATLKCIRCVERILSENAVRHGQQQRQYAAGLRCRHPHMHQVRRLPNHAAVTSLGGPAHHSRVCTALPPCMV